MINIGFTDIDNAKLIGRLLPFWSRGKKVSLLLQAILSPIISIHDRFKLWGLQRFIECQITAQKASLEWYLKYRLGSHFLREDDNFFIVHGINETISCFSSDVWRNGLHWDNSLRWNANKGSLINMGTDDYLESMGQTNVYAPAIVDTVNYNHEDYERDIRNIMSKYMINFNRINIIVADK